MTDAMLPRAARILVGCLAAVAMGVASHLALGGLRSALHAEPAAPPSADAVGASPVVLAAEPDRVPLPARTSLSGPTASPSPQRRRAGAPAPGTQPSRRPPRPHRRAAAPPRPERPAPRRRVQRPQAPAPEPSRPVAVAAARPELQVRSVRAGGGGDARQVLVTFAVRTSAQAAWRTLHLPVAVSAAPQDGAVRMDIAVTSTSDRLATDLAVARVDDAPAAPTAADVAPASDTRTNTVAVVVPLAVEGEAVPVAAPPAPFAAEPSRMAFDEPPSP